MDGISTDPLLQQVLPRHRVLQWPGLVWRIASSGNSSAEQCVHMYRCSLWAAGSSQPDQPTQREATQREQAPSEPTSTGVAFAKADSLYAKIWSTFRARREARS